MYRLSGRQYAGNGSRLCKVRACALESNCLPSAWQTRLEGPPTWHACTPKFSLPTVLSLQAVTRLHAVSSLPSYHCIQPAHYIQPEHLYTACTLYLSCMMYLALHSESSQTARLHSGLHSIFQIAHCIHSARCIQTARCTYSDCTLYVFRLHAVCIQTARCTYSDCTLYVF